MTKEGIYLVYILFTQENFFDNFVSLVISLDLVDITIKLL